MKVWSRMKEIGGFYIHNYYGSEFSHAERFGYVDPQEAKFISIEEIEKEYGKIIAVQDTCRSIYEDRCKLRIWTEKYVITIEEYDGLEYLVVLPRNPPPEAEVVK